MATVAWSGYWGDTAGQNGGYMLLVNKNPRRNPLRRTANRQGFRSTTALFGGLLGAATGSNVTKTYTRVAGGNNGLGQAPALEVITSINRNTTAADVTALKEMVFNVRTKPTYPRDLSGNGGPAY